MGTSDETYPARAARSTKCRNGALRKTAEQILGIPKVALIPDKEQRNRRYSMSLRSSAHEQWRARLSLVSTSMVGPDSPDSIRCRNRRSITARSANKFWVSFFCVRSRFTFLPSIFCDFTHSRVEDKFSELAVYMPLSSCASSIRLV